MKIAHFFAFSTSLLLRELWVVELPTIRSANKVGRLCLFVSFSIADNWLLLFCEDGCDSYVIFPSIHVDHRRCFFFPVKSKNFVAEEQVLCTHFLENFQKYWILIYFDELFLEWSGKMQQRLSQILFSNGVCANHELPSPLARGSDLQIYQHRYQRRR